MKIASKYIPNFMVIIIHCQHGGRHGVSLDIIHNQHFCILIGSFPCSLLMVLPIYDSEEASSKELRKNDIGIYVANST